MKRRRLTNRMSAMTLAAILLFALTPAAAFAGDVDISLPGWEIGEETAGTGSVSGTVKSYGVEGDGVTVKLVTLTGSTEASVTVTGNSASYRLEKIPAGIYYLRIEKPGHVPREYAVTVAEGSAVQDAEIYLRGDVDLSGEVDIGDHQRLFTYLQGTNPITDEYQKKIADTDESGGIDIGDHQRLFTHLQGTNPFQ